MSPHCRRLLADCCAGVWCSGSCLPEVLPRSSSAGVFRVQIAGRIRPPKSTFTHGHCTYRGKAWLFLAQPTASSPDQLRGSGFRLDNHYFKREREREKIIIKNILENVTDLSGL